MLNATKGSVYRYDHGAITGHELPGNRRTRVISRDDVNAKPNQIAGESHRSHEAQASANYKTRSAAHTSPVS